MGVGWGQSGAIVVGLSPGPAGRAVVRLRVWGARGGVLGIVVMPRARLALHRAGFGLRGNVARFRRSPFPCRARRRRRVRRGP
eukprot:3107030-Lingulodinium_polyedra.AAC.1